MENLNNEKVGPSFPRQSLPEQNSNKSLYNVAFAFMIVAMVGTGIGALYFIILAVTATHVNYFGNDLDKAIRVFYAIAAALCLISYAWNIPFIIKIKKGMKTYEKPSIAFGVCVLLFGNLISGILLLVMSPNKTEVPIVQPE